MIDWERVNEFRSEIGTEDFSEVVEIFLEEADEAVASLADCTDHIELRDKCHFLKGCALNLGFTDFGVLCGQGEHKSSGQVLTSVEIDNLTNCFYCSRNAFLAGI